jgi:hypothetical protein
VKASLVSTAGDSSRRKQKRRHGNLCRWVLQQTVSMRLDRMSGKGTKLEICVMVRKMLQLKKLQNLAEGRGFP